MLQIRDHNCWQSANSCTRIDSIALASQDPRHLDLTGLAPPLTSGVNSGTIDSVMASVEKLLEQMRREPANVGFGDLKKVCQAYFGKPRQDGSSHAIFKTPWPGDPRVNIQNTKGKAKPYQVRQVLQAIDKLEGKQ